MVAGMVNFAPLVPIVAGTSREELKGKARHRPLAAY
jgi:hypothetical protein